MRVWYIAISLFLKTSFMMSMSWNVSGLLAYVLFSTCLSMMLSTMELIFSSVYSFMLCDAASTQSAIISIACSRVVGVGPGYVKSFSSISSPGWAFLYDT